MSTDPWHDFIGRRCGKDERLEIRRKLGEGGVGAVFEAVDSQTSKSFAIKFLHDAWTNDAELVERFRNEGTLWKEIRHPNLVQVYGLGRQFGMPFILSEMVTGKQLEEILTEEGSLAPKESLRVAREVASGLQVIHRNDIIHRDLKPANILLENDSRRARLLDYGMAKYIQSTAMLTRPGDLLGTVGYMSPEQILGKELDPRADIFSLGVILVEMLTGGNAFVGADTRAILTATVKGELQGRDKIVELGGKPLWRAVEPLVDLNPKKRPADMGEVISVISEAEAAVSSPKSGAKSGLFGFLKRR